MVLFISFTTEKETKYIHPHGGSDNPGNDTNLVFHEPQGRLALMFQFSNDAGGHRQLKQYSSGKFVHPRGGHVGDQRALTLYDGSDGERTSVDMMLFEGRSYLIHGGSARYYAHPNGGSATPDNETEVVYHHDFRPSLSIEIVPAEEYEIISMEFDQNAINNMKSQIVAVQKDVRNDSSSVVTSAVSLSYSHSLTNTFTFSFTETIGIKVTSTSKATIGVAEESVAVEASFSFAATQTSSTSETEGVTATVTETVTLQPNHAVRVVVNTTNSRGKIPFTAMAKCARGQIIPIHGVAESSIFANQKVFVTDLNKN